MVPGSYRPTSLFVGQVQISLVKIRSERNVWHPERVFQQENEIFSLKRLVRRN